MKLTLSYYIRRNGVSLERRLFLFINQMRYQGDETSAAKIYSSSFECGELAHSQRENLDCRRMELNDDTCERDPDRCLSYLVPQTYSVCSFTCATLIWLADFAPDILFNNFDSFPLPSKNAVCSNDIGPTTTSPVVDTTASVFQNSTSHTTYFSSDHDVNGNVTERTTAQTSSVEENTGSSNVQMFIWIGALVAVFLLVLMFAALCCKIIRKRKRDRGGSVSPTVTDSPTPPSSEIVKVESSQTIETSSEEMEVVKYHTLDEMAVAAEIETNFDDCDDQGYTVIRVGSCRDWQMAGVRDESRVTRPLPQPPDSVGKDSRTSSSENTARGDQTTSIPSIPITITSRSPSSLDSNPLVGQPHLIPSRDRAGTCTTQPPPRPHKRQVHLENHTYLGLVNLRPDHAAFNLMREVKLVRTQHGHLELVSVQEELSALTEYYTRILLINQTDGDLGVVGLAEDTMNTSEREPCLNSLDERRGSLTRGSDLSDLDRCWLDTLDKAVRYPDDLGYSGQDIIYFGSLDLEDNRGVSSCDYLTVLDIDPNDLSSWGDRDFPVLDIDAIFGSPGSHLSD